MTEIFSGMPPIIRVKKLYHSTCPHNSMAWTGDLCEPVIPRRKYVGDLGFDLTLAKYITIPPHEARKGYTGIAIELPYGWGAFICDRSSTPYKGIKIAGGVIDNGYRGEIIIDVLNISNEWVNFNAGERIAQLVPIPLFPGYCIEELGELSKSERGTKGHGSTGK
jgi:dUTP pyrophosphatase